MEKMKRARDVHVNKLGQPKLLLKPLGHHSAMMFSNSGQHLHSSK